MNIGARRADGRARLGLVVCGVVAVGYLGWFFVWPLAAIVGRGIADSGQSFTALISSTLGSTRVRQIIGFTLLQASVSTLATFVLGLPLVAVLTRRRARGLAAVRTLVVVPFVLPTVVVAAGFDALFGAGGPLRALDLVPSTTVVVLAHVVFNLAVVVRVVGARWSTLDPELARAARVLGAGPMRVWTSVTLPLLAPAIAAAAAIVMLFCVTSFGVVLVLGGIGRSTIETEIYRLTTQELALDRAAVLVLVQLLVVAIVALVAGAFGRQRGIVRAVGARDVREPIRGVRTRVGVMLAVAPVSLLVVAPLAMLLARGCAHARVGWNFLRHDDFSGIVWTSSIAASLRAVAAATLLALVVGACATALLVTMRRGRRIVDVLFALPLGVSAVSIGFGFLIALDRPVDLRASWWLVPIAQATVALPFVIRTMVPAWRAIDPALREVAATLGTAPRSVRRRVDIPLLRPAIVTGAALAAAVALGEFGATAFVARADAPTVPIAIVRLLGRPGAAAHDAAYLLAAVLVVITALLAVVADRAATTGQGF